MKPERAAAICCLDLRCFVFMSDRPPHTLATHWAPQGLSWGSWDPPARSLALRPPAPFLAFFSDPSLPPSPFFPSSILCLLLPLFLLPFSLQLVLSPRGVKAAAGRSPLVALSCSLLGASLESSPRVSEKTGMSPEGPAGRGFHMLPPSEVTEASHGHVKNARYLC